MLAPAMPPCCHDASSASAIEAALAQLGVEDFSVLPPLDVSEPTQRKGRCGSSPGHARPVLQRQRAVMSVDELGEDGATPPRAKRAFRVYRRSGSVEFATTKRLFAHHCAAANVDEADADPAHSDKLQHNAAHHRMGRRLHWPY